MESVITTKQESSAERLASINNEQVGGIAFGSGDTPNHQTLISGDTTGDTLLKLLSCLQTTFLSWITIVRQTEESKSLSLTSGFLLTCEYFHCKRDCVSFLVGYKECARPD